MDSQVQNLEGIIRIATAGRPRLTAKGAATRQRIVDGMAAEVRERGATAARLEDVCTRVSVSKGQVFHYFPGGKEELLLAVARREADRVLEDQEPYLHDLTSWPAWHNWRDAVLARYERQGVNCPLGILITELGRATPAAQALTAQLVDRWQAALQAGIEHMQRRGEISTRIDAERTAAALLAVVQGGVTILMSTGRITHLEAALDASLDLLRASA